MNDILIKRDGKTIDCISGGTHEQTCLLKLHISLTQFICKDGGVRVNVRTERIAVECNDHLSVEQIRKVNKVLRTNEVYALYTCIRGQEQVKNSFRPIRGLPENQR